MINGIKPTRLWHLSGKKHIGKWVKERVSENPRNFRTRNENLKHLFLGVLGVIATSYMLGTLALPWDQTKPRDYNERGCEDFSKCAIPEKCMTESEYYYGPCED